MHPFIRWNQSKRDNIGNGRVDELEVLIYANEVILVNGILADMRIAFPTINDAYGIIPTLKFRCIFN